MKKSINYLIILFTISIILFSCNNSDNFKIDISDINAEVKIKRLDIDLFEFSPDSSDYYINYFKQNYGEFFKLYNHQIIAIGNPEDSLYSQNLGKFITWCENEKIPDTVMKKYPNLKTENKNLSLAFKHFKYYFPEENIPQIYTCISAFNQSIVTSENIIGIALDKYLGNNSLYYKRLAWEKYKKRRMTPEMIPVDVMRAHIQALFPYKSETDDMLANMIYEGKIQYFLSSVLPFIDDTLKWGYTKKQLSWAERNQENIWNYMTEAKLLFSTNKSEIKKHVGDGPFTVSFANISAPRAGVFIGYKIVSSFMRKNKNISLYELMKTDDATNILSNAKYNP